MRKNPCRGSYHTRRSKLGPNPHHHLPPVSKEVVHRKTKGTLTAKKGIPSTNHKFSFPQTYTTAKQRKTLRTFHKSTTSPLTKAPIERTPKEISKNNCETKETKTEAERQSAGPFRESQTITGNTPSRDKIFTHLYPL